MGKKTNREERKNSPLRRLMHNESDKRVTHSTCPIPGKLGIKIYYTCLISEFLCILKEAFTSDTIMCFKRRFVFAHYFFDKKRLLAKINVCK